MTTPPAPHPGSSCPAGEQARRSDRDLRARVLADRIAPYAPVDGDRVRLVYGDGSTVEGRWEHLGGEDLTAALRLDDGSLHRHVAGHVEHILVHRTARTRRPVAGPAARTAREHAVSMWRHTAAAVDRERRPGVAR